MYPGNGGGVTSSQQSNLDTNKSKDGTLMNDMKKWRPEDPPTSNVATSIRHSWPYNWALLLYVWKSSRVNHWECVHYVCSMYTRAACVRLRWAARYRTRLAGRKLLYRQFDTQAAFVRNVQSGTVGVVENQRDKRVLLTMIDTIGKLTREGCNPLLLVAVDTVSILFYVILCIAML